VGVAAQHLVLAGGVGAMGLLALMLFLARQRDSVPLWLGLFCLSLWLHFMIGPAHELGRASAYLAASFLALFSYAVFPSASPRWIPGSFVALGATAALAALMLPAAWQPQLLVCMQGLGLLIGTWATVVGVKLALSRKNGWPMFIVTTAFGYPLLVLQVLNGLLFDQLVAPLGLIAFVATPGVVITRRLTRFFDAEALRASNQAKFTADLLDSVPVALAMRDLQGKYLFVNRTWESYFGAKRADVIGSTPRVRASEEETNAVLAQDRAALKRGLGAPPQLLDFELRGRRYMQSRTVMADSQGKTLGVLIASLDTTERFAIEQALATEQRRMALVVYAARVGILDWDGVSHSVYYSARFREILGYAADADTSTWPDYFEFVHPEDRERVQRTFREHITGRGPEGMRELHEPIEYRLRRADGSYIWIEGVGVSVRDAKGYVSRFIASVSDITERRSYQEALKQSVRLREEVERMSRHDLKTPLNSIIAVPRLLRDGRTLTSEDEQLLSIIERAGYRILNMVNLSLDLFRMEQGSYQFRPQAVDLVDMVQKVVADLESHAASKAVSVRTVRKPEGVPLIARGEDLLCYSMLANLLKNAIEASPEGRVVTVTLEARAGMLLQLHNDGAVPEAVRTSFFHKYTTAGKQGGLGLGTYSARLMAKVQEGGIEMRTSEEEGTTLIVRLAEAPAGSLPATMLPAERAAAAPAAGASHVYLPELPRLSVMVVDDDEFNRLVMRRYLPSPPLQLAMAVNGRAALEAARRQPPDVIFLDLEMPVMSGYEAVERLRADELSEGRKRAKVIAFSSNDDEATIKRALAAGCDHYLAKPAPRETLWKLLLSQPVAVNAPQSQAALASDPVEVDADLRTTLPAFYVSRRRALETIASALANNERAVVKRQSHRLAGSFALYGFKWAAAECRAIQLDALTGDATALAARVKAVRAHLDATEPQFHEVARPAA
jgi:PAS domain S-box-containing protein